MYIYMSGWKYIILKRSIGKKVIYKSLMMMKTDKCQVKLVKFICPVHLLRVSISEGLTQADS